MLCGATNAILRDRLFVGVFGCESVAQSFGQFLETSAGIAFQTVVPTLLVSGFAVLA